MLHLLYGRLATARRAWYERRPASRRRLRQPVVSIGNLSVGGTGKTPLVAAVAQWLVERGEQPAILSRGYARPDRTPEPTVVSDGHRLSATARTAGDEPLMLARAVPGAIVVVGANRHAAGQLAEGTLGATVHLLDDGFQHVRLARDLDVVVTPAGALANDAVLPKGRLREPLTALSRAGLLVVVGADDAAAAVEARRYGVPAAIGATRRLGAAIGVGGDAPPAGARVVVMAGIGQPQQFVAAVTAAGWQVAATRLFADHHWFTAADLASVARDVAAHDAWGVLTTDKDAVRLETLSSLPCRVARVPLVLDVAGWATLANAIDAVLRTRPHAASPTAGGAA